MHRVNFHRFLIFSLTRKKKERERTILVAKKKTPTKQIPHPQH